MAEGIFKASFNRRHWFLLLIASLCLSACSTTPSPWRDDAVNALHAARQESADKHLPTEFESVHIAFSQAELLLQQGKDEEADRFYQLTVIKGRMLHKNVIAKTAQLLHGAGEANRASLERARERAILQAKEQAALANEEILSLRPAEPAARPAGSPEKANRKGAKPTLYLTFDDGPSPLTLTIARYLKSEGINATFFTVGRNIKGHEQLVKDTIGNGHTVANHTFTHDARRLSASPSALNGEIARTAALLDQLGGDGLLVRIPYGSNTIRRRISQISDPSVQIIDWDVDSNDTRPEGLGNHAFIARSVLNQLKNRHRENIVILFHDGAGHQETLAALKELVPRLKREGYRFAGLSRESQVAWVRKPQGTGLVAATKSDRRPKVRL